MPLPTGGRKESTRRPPAKVPSWHLTGKKAMKYVNDANTRKEAKQNKVDKEAKVKKEAVNKHRAAEQKSKRTAQK